MLLLVADTRKISSIASRLRKWRERWTVGFALYCAFRVNRAKKVYVQDWVQEMDAEALRLLSEGAKFYICRHASMAGRLGKGSGGNGEEE